MPYSILDILINEVANALGITPTEVKRRFTQEQLNDLLNNSLCTPLGDTAVPFASTEVPCDDLAVPALLPQIDVNIEVNIEVPYTIPELSQNITISIFRILIQIKSSGEKFILFYEIS